MSEIKIEEIDTVILCGGLGTRLKDLTKDLPKPISSEKKIEEVPINASVEDKGSKINEGTGSN